MSTEVKPYFQIGEAKENLGEEDETPNEDRLQNWGQWVDSKINDRLRYLFPNMTVNLTEQDFIDNGFTKADYASLQDLATAGLEAKFWKETNGDNEAWDKWFKQELPQWIRDLTAVPSTTL